mmetsp:Transcript_111058/g.354213  ORF Transcript_111058/g.354213 Transcript_111058/m.354213 type:complete len:259 (+) Transcript_111058:102-878(+)
MGAPAASSGATAWRANSVAALVAARRTTAPSNLPSGGSGQALPSRAFAEKRCHHETCNPCAFKARPTQRLKSSTSRTLAGAGIPVGPPSPMPSTSSMAAACIAPRCELTSATTAEARSASIFRTALCPLPGVPSISSAYPMRPIACQSKSPRVMSSRARSSNGGRESRSCNCPTAQATSPTSAPAKQVRSACATSTAALLCATPRAAQATRALASPCGCHHSTSEARVTSASTISGSARRDSSAFASLPRAQRELATL